MTTERQRQQEARAKAMREAKAELQRVEQVTSVAESLYNELDKLNRKAPAMTISKLTLERVNKVIRTAKDLIGKGDEFIEDISEFVPAGDMPEYRDVVLTISQVIAGIKRFRSTRAKAWRDAGLTL